MNPVICCPPVCGMACAARALSRSGISVSVRPGAECTHLLLPVPSYSGGIPKFPPELLDQIPSEAVILGGMLPEIPGHPAVDLLKDPLYLAKNAAVTAQCALTLAAARLPVVWEKLPVLILGWGRIGRFLALKLSVLGAAVSVAARRLESRAEIEALGLEALDIRHLYDEISRFRLIYNTVPAPVLSAGEAERCRIDCLKIELASSPGIAGDGIVDGRGLPGRLAPESAGQLIAETVCRLIKEEKL